jgi:hypothetical protein
MLENQQPGLTSSYAAPSRLLDIVKAYVNVGRCGIAYAIRVALAAPNLARIPLVRDEQAPPEG